MATELKREAVGKIYVFVRVKVIYVSVNEINILGVSVQHEADLCYAQPKR